MNVVVIMGRLTADPELRRTASQVAVSAFTVAVDRRFVPKGEERQTDFIDCVAWRQTAEFLCRHFHKGQRIAVTGELQMRQFTDKNGNKRTVYEVIADNVEFCESKPQGNRPATSTIMPDEYEEIAGDDSLFP